jgi:5-methyltetrahydropteroyltriglutamate--homocysteine methyltransferase
MAPRPARGEGSFEALRHFPKDKLAILGLISNHGDAETREYLHQRLREASSFIDLDQVALCPRCGFGSAPEEAQWAKLAVMQQVAGEAWH